MDAYGTMSCVVVIGGVPQCQLVPPGLDDLKWIAADSGLDLARALGRRCDLVIGDLDSVSGAALSWAEAVDTAIERHSLDKDRTDFELALASAVDAGATRIVVLGGEGGRLDHLVGNVATLAGDALAGIEVEAWIGTARVDIVRSRRTIPGVVGTAVSLAAWGGPARGVCTEGLRWPLASAELLAGSGWGTSNRFTAAHAVVSLSSGVLSVITPDASESAGVTAHAVGVAGATS